MDLALAVAGPGNVTQLVRSFLLSRAASTAAKTSGEQLTKGELVDFLLVGDSRYVGSTVIRKDTTVVLTDDVVLANGATVPKGSIVVVNGDAMKIVQPDGGVFRGRYSQYVAEEKSLPLLRFKMVRFFLILLILLKGLLILSPRQ